MTVVREFLSLNEKMKKHHNSNKRVLKKSQFHDRKEGIELQNASHCVRCSPMAKHNRKKITPFISKISPASKRTNQTKNRFAIFTPSISPELEAASSFEIPPYLSLHDLEKINAVSPHFRPRSPNDAEGLHSCLHSLHSFSFDQYLLPLRNHTQVNETENSSRVNCSQKRLRIARSDETYLHESLFHHSMTSEQNKLAEKMNRAVNFGLAQGIDLLSALEFSRGIPKYCTEVFLNGDVNHELPLKIIDRIEKSLREWLEIDGGVWKELSNVHGHR
mmetsp:Transcript_24969/g.57697  ORF Transcript_24969/g.57697 Transcript_24969/m.57697 type:complete len:275 (-) Transcript_24969:241-1065(-)